MRSRSARLGFPRKAATRSLRLRALRPLRCERHPEERPSFAPAIAFRQSGCSGWRCARVVLTLENQRGALNFAEPLMHIEARDHFTNRSLDCRVVGKDGLVTRSMMSGRSLLKCGVNQRSRPDARTAAMPSVRTSVARALIPLRPASVNVGDIPIRIKLRTRSRRARTVACASTPPKDIPARWTGRSLTNSIRGPVSGVGSSRICQACSHDSFAQLAPGHDSAILASPC